MKKVYIGIVLLFALLIIIIINLNNSFTYGYQYEMDNTMLFYKDDEVELEKDIKKYLSNIDDILVPNAIFEDSNVLIENYKFLTYFALDYILEHYEYYNDKIIILDSFDYITKEGINEKTDKYIDLEELYKITNKFFNISYYQVVNDDINIINNKISLINYTDRYFKLEIEDIDIEVNNNLIIANVIYTNNNKYKYIFTNNNNILTINNIEVIYE